MADISSYLSDIMSAVYGEEVRESIRNAIDAIDAEVQDLKGYIATMAGMTNMWYVTEKNHWSDDDYPNEVLFSIGRNIVADSTIQVIWEMELDYFGVINPNAVDVESETLTFTYGVPAIEGAVTYDGDNTFSLTYEPEVDVRESIEYVEAYPRDGQMALSAGWLSATSGGDALTPETGKIYILMVDSWVYSAHSQFYWSGATYVKLEDIEFHIDFNISYYTNDSDANSVTNYVDDAIASIMAQRLSPRSGSISYETGWGPYSVTEMPVLKKLGNNVTFYGAFKFTGSEFTLNGTDKETIATIPEEYRPEKSVNALCQGSGSFAWLITVSAIDGTVAISRFRNESNVSQSINASRWFPFSLSWTTAQ